MEFITYETEGFVGILTINRPKALNALNSHCLLYTSRKGRAGRGAQIPPSG